MEAVVASGGGENTASRARAYVCVLGYTTKCCTIFFYPPPLLRALQGPRPVFNHTNTDTPTVAQQHRLTHGEAAFAPPLARAVDCPSQYPRSPHRRARGDARAMTTQQQHHHCSQHPNFHRSQSRCSRPCAFLVFLLASIFSPRTPRPFADARTSAAMATLRVWKRWHWLLSFSGVGGGGGVCVERPPRSMEKYEDVPYACEVLRFSPSEGALHTFAGS